MIRRLDEIIYHLSRNRDNNWAWRSLKKRPQHTPKQNKNGEELGEFLAEETHQYRSIMKEMEDENIELCRYQQHSIVTVQECIERTAIIKQFDIKPHKGIMRTQGCAYSAHTHFFDKTLQRTVKLDASEQGASPSSPHWDENHPHWKGQHDECTLEPWGARCVYGNHRTEETNETHMANDSKVGTTQIACREKRVKRGGPNTALLAAMRKYEIEHPLVNMDHDDHYDNHNYDEYDDDNYNYDEYDNDYDYHYEYPYENEDEDAATITGLH